MEKDTTIIIPMYNMGELIGETLDGFAKQTDKNFKIIIVDDGSTDNGYDIIKQWQNKGCLEIEYVLQDNSGVSSARNNGLDHCKTPYVLFCDADDIMPFYTVELIRNNIKRFDVVGGNAKRFISEINPMLKSTESQKGIDCLMNKFLHDNVSLHFCSFAYRMEILNRYNIRFSSDLKYGEDEEFTWKYLCHCKTAIYTTNILYYYRQNPLSATNKISWLRTNGLDSMIRVSEYYMNKKHPFGQELKSLGVPKEKLYILKLFAKAQRKDLYYKLIECEEYLDYNVKSLIKFPDFKIRMTAILYCISTQLCFSLLKRV